MIDIILVSMRDAFVQVAAFVAVTVLVFGLFEYRTEGALVDWLSRNERLQPVSGALLGLTPGCGGAILVMPLYVRGTVSFGTVVATLAATAGDSAFVILALAPEAALYAYGLAFAAAVLTGYLVDTTGAGIGRLDHLVRTTDPAADGGDVHAAACRTGGVRHSIFTPLAGVLVAAWWVTALAGLTLGVAYLAFGAPDVAFRFGLGFDGLFTVFGLTGTVLSFAVYGGARRYLDAAAGEFGRLRAPFVHAAVETSFVTVWVVAAYLAYEFSVVGLGLDVAAAAAAAGILAPIAGAVVGLIPGCGPQIVLAAAYAQGGIPFSTLVANAISQDGDALFPLLAVDKRAAVAATLWTTVPALAVGVAVHLAVGPLFGFGVLG